MSNRLRLMLEAAKKTEVRMVLIFQENPTPRNFARLETVQNLVRTCGQKYVEMISDSLSRG